MAGTLYKFPQDVFFDNIDPLEQNYYDFLEISDTFLGWLLTLNQDEFDEVYTRLVFPPGIIINGKENLSLALPMVELARKEVWEVLSSEVDKRQVELRAYVRVIYLVKSGMLRYQVGDIDSMWKIEMTDEGRRLADALSIVDSLILNKNENQKQKDNQEA